jgi:chorismate mutase/prephenate dehydratase
VGDIKRAEGSPVFRPEREIQVIRQLREHNPGPLKPDSIGAIWREIMSGCRALEARQRVAFLGPAGTFSEEAALRFFGSSMDRLPCASFDEVFRTTVAGAADFGVVPVENSTEGVVARSLDLFLNTPVHIVGETSLMVRHNLLRTRPSLEGIEVVHAHPQALAQCQGWLNKHLPTAERRASSSNAEGARLALTNPAWAGIAGERAASEFGLQMAAQAIQDDAFNRTRFVVICLPSTLPVPAASGKDCISLIVSVPNRPGAVHDLLQPLKQHGVSMSRLESRPARSGQWEYYFYIDLQGHPSQPHVASALKDLQSLCAFYKLLGAYPLAEES